MQYYHAVPKPIVLQLQELALSKECSATDLLRKALLVATKLNLEEFKLWATHELSGYPDANVPEYRQVRCELRLKNPQRGLVPIVFEVQEAADYFCNVPLQASIGSISEALSDRSSGGALTIPLSATEQSFFLKSQKEELGLTFGAMPAIRIIGRSQVAHIVDSVYNTALAWALRLENEGILGSELTFTDSEREKAAISHIRIENFQGILGNVTQSRVNQELLLNVTRGDLASLKEYLPKLGVTTGEITELETALTVDPAPTSRQTLGPKTRDWLGKVMLRLAAGAADVGIHASGDLVAHAIWHYFGL